MSEPTKRRDESEEEKMERKQILKQLIDRLSRGEDIASVRADFKRYFEDVPADEIAAAERLLMEEGMRVEEVQQMCDVHASLFEGAVRQKDEVPEGHPLFVFRRENDGLEHFLDNMLMPVWEAYHMIGGEDAREGLLVALRELQKIDRHYSRKENLFFPYLEKAGVSGPPKVMWGVDDEIRALIKGMRAAVETGDRDGAMRLYPQMMEKIRAMIRKENEILRPLLLENLKEEDFRTIAGESAQIGFAFIDGVEGASLSDTRAYARTGSAAAEPESGASIRLPSGFFETAELTALLNALPCDVTFVGADDRVHFFSEQKKRVFPRTRTIIGRRVADCHPPKSLPQVQALIVAFREGRKDSESYWIQRGGAFVLIRYYAVRDPEGNYLGVLECTEEISALRALEGEKTLMS